MGIGDTALNIRRHARRNSLWIAAAVLTVLAIPAFILLRAKLRPAPGDHNIQSIAVLPFTNLSGDPSQEYFADAMTDEMTSDLAKIGALHVISRTSAMHYKGSAHTTPQIAQELNVDGIIEGSVIRTGNRVRITVQLINARSDIHIWSDSYEHDFGDVLALQNELAHTIAAQVRAVISPTEEASMRQQPVQPAAYEAYLLGRSQLEKWTISGGTEALHYFQRAIQIDPHFALGYVGIADCYSSFMGVDGVGYREGLDRASEALNQAIALKPDMGEAHVMLGAVRMQRDWDFAGAEAEMRKGLALSPSYVAGHHWYSHLLLYLGRYDESMVEARKMLELDPLSPAANLHFGYEYRATREWDKAIAQQKKTLELDPG
jgi:TolB-like protein